MKCALSLLAALTLALPAQAQITLGRLFATPAERTTMDASRGAHAALLPNSQGAAPEPPPAPASFVPSDTQATDATTAIANANAPATPPSELTMTGILRSSDHRSVVFLNGIPQPAGPKMLITLPSGKKILLKPGQRYDLNERRIKDVNEP
ncbi:hypothetical protein GTP46_28845 [Duganella sp. FT135W]|uniref:Type II secretion system protein GspC N-terminal domain-containing protein n=1 Tax=Duganella flavida TaxID=2692175 RepID=A0A6L8KLP1_9BURK|nr:hypothetical protein [Duganella flavida]MYM26634.1 hypothetical protein [Duganella flavida]